MIIKSRMRALLAGAMVCAAGIVSSHAASSTFVTFSVDMSTNILLGTFNPPPGGTDFVNVRGTFDGWSANGVTLVQQGSSTIYTNTVNDTTDTNGGALFYLFVINNTTSEKPVANMDGGNRSVLLPTTSGASLVLPTPFFSDAGATVTNNIIFQVDVSQQIALGQFVLGTSVVTVRGNNYGNFTDPTPLFPLNTLTNDPTILRTNQYGLVTSNVYVGTLEITNSPNASMSYKFVYATGANTYWDSPAAPNADNGGNRYFMNYGQTLPIVNFADQPYAPLCATVFSVDMSGPANLDAGYDSTTVRIDGSFNGWAQDVAMTNNPSAANLNLFSTTILTGQGANLQFQYRYNSFGATVYDHLNGATGGQGNRLLTVPSLANYTVPPVYFNDASYNDYLLSPVTVTFTIDMTGAVGTDNTVWAPGSSVFVNGPWPNWLSWDPISLAGQVLTEVGSTPIYTGTFTIPKGIVTSLTYKYSLNGGDNEAAQDANHARVIRSTVTGSYSFAQDKFGNQYVEPSFGQLSVGSASAGNVPLSWLGRPGCEIQIKSGSVDVGPWTSLPQTDGTNWNAGTMSTNGLLSQTNWPASSGNLFFRLIKQ